MALADLVKNIKVASTEFIKKEQIFPLFETWQVGYSAFTYDFSAKDRLVKYVKNQEEHHKKETYKRELIRLLKEQGVNFDERFLF